jgi:hypothetical protein
MTVGGLIHNLAVFADFYERASADIEREEGVTKPWYIGNRDANADVMQRDFRAMVAIDRVRAYVLAKYGADLTIGTARRLLGDLIRLCSLTVKAAEELPLEDAMDKLGAAESRRDDAGYLESKGARACDAKNVVPPHPAPTPSGPQATLCAIRAFLNCALGIHQEQLQLAGGADNGSPEDCPYRRDWRGIVGQREAELNRLYAAALAEADRTGFPIPEVERRLRALQREVVALLLWPRDAPELSEEERKSRTADGCWSGGPVGDYLSRNSNRMFDAWQEVESLALRVEAPARPASPEGTAKGATADISATPTETPAGLQTGDPSSRGRRADYSPFTRPVPSGPEPKGKPMADHSQPLGAGGLSHFELPTIFRCAVELAEAAAGLTETEWADVPANCEGPTSPIFERQMEASRRLRRIEEETERLKRSLGATGPLGHADGEKDGGPKWESYHRRFNNTTHDRIARLALTKLATAAIDLSGFAYWREWQWHMRETGLRLLAWGLAQLWEGMSGEERSRVRDHLPRTHKAIGWPADPATDPRSYDGPEEIPLADQYRIISNYISCYRDYLDDVVKANHRRVEQGQEKFLRRATPTEFVAMAERTEQALQAWAKRDFDTPSEWGKLYTTAFWSLACLRRAQEIQPREVWPASMLEQRKLLADAAGILLTCVGGTPEAKAGMKPEDADEAFEEFTKATSHLRNAVADQPPTEAAWDKLELIHDDDRGLRQAKNPPADVRLDQSTIAASQAILAHVDSLATLNTAMRQMVVSLGAKHAGGAAPGYIPTETAPAPKRSTERGEGRVKLIAALTKHHQYADGSCLNLEHIGNNELAKVAGVSQSTASAFFNDKFQGHTKYKALCRDAGKLAAALKLLNDEFAPYHLLGDSSSNLAAPEEEDTDAE